MTDFEIVGRNIKQFRKAMGQSQQAMALDLQISPGNLSLIEQGKANPSLEKLVGFARYFSVPIKRLFDQPVPDVRKEHLSTQRSARYCYLINKALIYQDDLGEYTSYGIEILRRDKGSWNSVDITYDVTTDWTSLREFVDLLNREDVHPVHIWDLLEDFLDN